MQRAISLKVLPAQAADTKVIRQLAAAAAGVAPEAVTGYYINKRSIDARSCPVHIILSLQVFIEEPFHDRTLIPLYYGDVTDARQEAVIVGAGPAGLFAALHCIERGIRPIVLERGRDVRGRRRDLALLNKEGIVNPESNYCFGEGGAGTYSDGKLYTRSRKRGDVQRILSIFVHFGADESILYDAHPHIGTNKLPHIITAMSQRIRDCGGVIRFDTKVTDILIREGAVTGIRTSQGDTVPASAVILCTGHSARDIFTLLQHRQVPVETKPFALGVRVEHPQALVDSIQYHCAVRGGLLPPASYNLVHQAGGRGVFSFCMCPGGIIAPAATAAGEVVVNGWSPSKRNNLFANSGIVASVELKDLQAFEKYGALAAMYFQQETEQKAFRAGGGSLVAPAQRMPDFVSGRISAALPPCSYLPGIAPADLQTVLPPFIYRALKESFRAFGRKMKGYFTEEAVIVATESRTSSPVRIPRDPHSLQHPQVSGLYPCGEGAGYAGGIVSAAMDGERIAAALPVKQQG